MQLNVILHPTDFSESASHALRLAVHLATSHQARLVIFHADSLHGEHLEAEDGALDRYAATARDLMEHDMAGAGSTVEVSQGRTVLPFDGIMEAAADQRPDLIVIGTHGHSRFSRLLMGSTAEKVLRHAPCSVLTVRAGTPIPEDGQFRKILVPVDFSESASVGPDGARAIRADDQSTLYLVHVVDPAPPMYLERFSNRPCTTWGGRGTSARTDAGGLMRAYSMDLRERVLLDSDAGMKAADVAAKYRVSGSWVRLLKQRRRDTGEVAPRVQRHGRRCMLEPHLHTLADLIAAQPDRTLAELKDALATPARVPTVWRAVRALGLTV